MSIKVRGAFEQQLPPPPIPAFDQYRPGLIITTVEHGGKTAGRLGPPDQSGHQHDAGQARRAVLSQPDTT